MNQELMMWLGLDNSPRFYYPPHAAGLTELAVLDRLQIRQQSVIVMSTLRIALFATQGLLRLGNYIKHPSNPSQIHETHRIH